MGQRVLDMEARVHAAQAEAAKQVEAAADILEIQAQEANRALE